MLVLAARASAVQAAGVMPQPTPTDRTRVRRAPKRAAYDRDTINAILDAGLVCHVAFAVDGQPYVIPTSYARVDDDLIIHGSTASRMMRSLAAGAPLCVNVSFVDGLVLARSGFHHSVNYRSVVILGTALEVTEPADKLAGLRAVLEHVAPGRWPHTRPPNERELKATAVLRIPIAEASAKVRTGPPIDDEPDYELPHWAGEIPLTITVGAPVPDARLAPSTPVPEHVEHARTHARYASDATFRSPSSSR